MTSDSARRKARAAWLALSAAAAFCAVAVGARALNTLLRTDEATQLDYLGLGEPLWHGVPSAAAIGWHMPMASLAASVLFDHGGPRARAWLAAASAAAFVALCAAVHSPLLALAALPLWLLSGPQSFPQSAQTALVLLVCGLLVERRRRPGIAAASALAAAVGASLLLRSTLAFLPPLLALAWTLDARRRGRRPDGRELAIVLALPYLFLLPWIGFNAAATGRFVLFENGQADSNVATGALGLVGTVEGQWRTLCPGLGGRPVLLWAAGQVLSHPLRYAAAVARRLWLVLGWNPLLLPLAAAGVIRSRGRGAVGDLGLAAAYLLGVHCLMTVEWTYFAPLRAVAAVLAASLLIPAVPPAGAETAARFFRCALAALLLACAATWERLLRYPSASRAPGAEARALAGHGGDFWLLHREGMELLAQGRFRAAVPPLSRAASLAGYDRYALDERWAEALAGNPNPLLRWNPARPQGPALMRRMLLLKASAASAAAAPGEARRFLERARKAAAAAAFARQAAYPLDSAATSRLRRAGDESFLGSLPAGLGASLRAGGQEPPPRPRAAAAEPSLLSNPWEMLHQSALALQRYPAARGLACRMLAFLAARQPASGADRRDLAVCEFLQGDRAAARADLERAVGLDPADASAQLSLATLLSLAGDRAEARRACRSALRLAESDPGVTAAVYDACGGAAGAD